jgi:hypothetical protein
MIQLDQPTIETALPLVGDGLEKYCWLRAALPNTDVSRDREFQRRFNGFYRVRRNQDWQSAFYPLLERQKTAPLPFADVLRQLHTSTGRVEASFASKLVATVEPDQPVIDAFVLENLGLRLPPTGPVEERLARAVRCHDEIRSSYRQYLVTPAGQHLDDRPDERLPG